MKKKKKQAADQPAERSDRRAEIHMQSPTAVAVDAMSTGVVLGSHVKHEHQAGSDSDLLQVGDVDADALGNAYVGDDTPGGDTPTPDQGQVDDIGRAYGVQEADSGELRTSSELLDQRDRHRQDHDAPRPSHGTRDDDRERTR